MMIAISRRRPGRTSRAPRALTTAVGVAAVAEMLALLVVLVSPLAALGAISFGCAVALFVAVRRLHAEIKRTEPDSAPS